MKTHTTYSARLQSSYISYSGSLELRLSDSEEIQIEATIDQLRSLQRQIEDRVKTLDLRAIASLKERMETVDE
jgi:hypothetical protein